jgi:hypothetical protein
MTLRKTKRSIGPQLQATMRDLRVHRIVPIRAQIWAGDVTAAALPAQAVGMEYADFVTSDRFLDQPDREMPIGSTACSQVARANQAKKSSSVAPVRPASLESFRRPA